MTYPCPSKSFSRVSQTNLPVVLGGTCAACGKWVRARKDNLEPWKHNPKRKSQ